LPLAQQLSEISKTGNFLIFSGACVNSGPPTAFSSTSYGPRVVYGSGLTTYSKLVSLASGMSEVLVQLAGVAFLTNFFNKLNPFNLRGVFTQE